MGTDSVIQFTVVRDSGAIEESNNHGKETGGTCRVTKAPMAEVSVQASATAVAAGVPANASGCVGVAARHHVMVPRLSFRMLPYTKAHTPGDSTVSIRLL
jgi:hypothetical protein